MKIKHMIYLFLDPNFSFDETFDKQSLRWYRDLFYERNSGHNKNISDKEFLLKWDYIRKVGKKLYPTRAAVMLFGSQMAVCHMIPRPTLDVQWITVNKDDSLPSMRWLDRYVSEENLITTWIELIAKYIKRAVKPFRIDPHTLLRDDTPFEFRVFREAAINLFVHQDYADPSRKSVIKFFQDCIQFWNPGDIFGSRINLLNSGEKELRNPKIAAAFRRISICEQAGTGFPMIMEEWQKFGYAKPQYTNDRAFQAFDLILPETRKQRPQIRPEWKPESMQDSIIDLLSKQNLSKSEITKMLGHSQVSGGLKKTLKKMLEENIIAFAIPEDPNNRLQKYKISKPKPELRPEWKPESMQRNILDLLFIQDLSKLEIAQMLGHSQISGGLKKVFKKMLEESIIAFTIPEKPQSRLQKYKITKKGLEFLKKHG